VKKLLIPLFLLGAIVVFVAPGAFATRGTATAKVDACVLLPDKTSSTRYEQYDRPFLTAAFKNAGVPASILNALGSAQTQRSQADQCITNGAKVILVDPLDSGTGAAIEKVAATKGVKTIDYDRLTLNGSASYYVSFNNVDVGKTMGKGLVAAIAAKHLTKPVVSILNGGITDNNAKLFKQGYESVLNPLFKSGKYVKAKSGNQWTDWDYNKGLAAFEQMLAANGNHIDASIAANDNLAGAVVAALKARHLKPIPVTGQDATPQGVQYILAGWQSGTVFKNLKTEANTAAQAAIQIIKGQKVKTNAVINNGKKNVKSIFLPPIWVTKKNYTILFTTGFVKKSAVCIGEYKKYCK
jgi:D-xylose transport system substrate-binding protein